MMAVSLPSPVALCFVSYHKLLLLCPHPGLGRVAFQASMDGDILGSSLFLENAVRQAICNNPCQFWHLETQGGHHLRDLEGSQG